MSEWRETTVADLAKSVVGGPFGSSLGRKDYVNAGVPVIRGAQLSLGGGFRLDDFVFVTEEKADKHSGNLAFPGDVIVTQRGTLGQVGLVPLDCEYSRLLLSQSQMKITVDPDKADPRFIYYALLDPDNRQRLLDHAMSAGVPHINLATLREFRLSIPSVEVQRASAAALQAFDGLIESNHQRIALLEQMAQAIYREWFVRFRYPGHENAERVHSPLGSIPAGWETTVAGELMDLDKGVSYKGSFLSSDGIPMVNLKCFAPAGGFRYDALKGYSGPTKAQHRVRPGDLVMANTDLTQAGAIVGRVAFVPSFPDFDELLVSHHVFAVRPRALSRSFLSHALSEARFRDHARSRASGTTVLGLRREDVLAYRMLCPPPHLVDSFVVIADLMQRQVDLALTAIRSLERMRDLLLPKLVTGAIDVSKLDLDVLLEDSAA